MVTKVRGERVGKRHNNDVAEGPSRTQRKQMTKSRNARKARKNRK